MLTNSECHLKKKKKSQCQIFTVIHFESFTEGTLHFMTHAKAKHLSTQQTAICPSHEHTPRLPAPSLTLITCHVTATLSVEKHSQCHFVFVPFTHHPLLQIFKCDVIGPSSTSWSPSVNVGELVPCRPYVNGPIIYLHAALHFTSH